MTSTNSLSLIVQTTLLLTSCIAVYAHTLFLFPAFVSDLVHQRLLLLAMLSPEDGSFAQHEHSPGDAFVYSQ